MTYTRSCRVVQIMEEPDKNSSTIFILDNNSTVDSSDNLTVDNAISLSTSVATAGSPGSNVTDQAADVSPIKKFDYLNPMWDVAFSGTVLSGTVGNLIVLWIVLGKKPS